MGGIQKREAGLVGFDEEVRLDGWSGYTFHVVSLTLLCQSWFSITPVLLISFLAPFFFLFLM